MNIKNIKLSRKNFSIYNLLLALIISMNAIKYIFMNINGMNVYVYGIYIAFIVFSLSRNTARISRRFNKDIGYSIIIFLLLVNYAMITAFINGNGAIVEFFKMLVSLGVAYAVFIMPTENFGRVINYTIVIIFFYILIILINPQKKIDYLHTAGNYLTATLPIGLTLSIILIRCILLFYNKNEGKIVIKNYLLAVFYFVGLLQFPARGSMLFPFIIAGFGVFILGKKRRIKFVFALSAFILFVFVLYKLFMNYASSLAIKRMLRLVQQSDSETRWEVWKEYIEYIIDNRWYILGGGINSSMKYLNMYPHNFYLQLIGEYGLLGIAACVNSTYVSVKSQLSILKIMISKKLISCKGMYIFCEIMAGLMYFYLNFMKSFSLYDICPMLIFLAAILRIYVDCTNSRALNLDRI